MKKLSCGVLIEDNTHHFLACHPTNWPWEDGNWDIPKGRHEEGETYLQTTLRELKEETGLDFERYQSQFKSYGLYEYDENKNLYIFYFKYDGELNPQALVCSSYFKDKKDHLTLKPEMNAFALVDKQNTNRYFRKLRRIVNDVILKL